MNMDERHHLSMEHYCKLCVNVNPFLSLIECELNSVKSSIRLRKW